MRRKDEKNCEAQRRRIMDAARELFARKGYDASNVDSVAAAAGVNKATIYYYFPSKREILKALLHDSWLKRTSKASATGLLQERDPRRFLRRLAAIHLGDMKDKEGRDFHRILLTECLRDPSLARENVLQTDRTRAEYAHALRPLFGKGVSERRLKQSLHQFKGSLLYYAQFTRLMGIPPSGLGSEKDYVESLVDTFTRGLRG